MKMKSRSRKEGRRTGKHHGALNSTTFIPLSTGRWNGGIACAPYEAVVSVPKTDSKPPELRQKSCRVGASKEEGIS